MQTLSPKTYPSLKTTVNIFIFHYLQISNSFRRCYF